MINVDLEQYDESIDKKLDKVILKEDDIISDIASEHAATRIKIDDYGVVINAIKDDTYKIYDKSMIKSIQTGRGESIGPKTIYFFPVNLAKTFIYVTAEGWAAYTDLTNSSMRVLLSSNTSDYNWQVIEFC